MGALAEKVANNSRLLQHLVQLGLVGELDVRAAAKRQKEMGGDILDALVEGGLVLEPDLAAALATFYRLPEVNLTRVRVTKQALRRASGEFCRRHQVLPFGVDGRTNELLVAISNPAQVSAIDALRFRNGINVRTFITPRSQLREAIEYYYFNDPLSVEASGSVPAAAAVSKRRTRRERDESSGRLRRPITDPRLQAETTSGLQTLSKSPSQEFFFGSVSDEPSVFTKGQGPGTEDLGTVGVPADHSGDLFSDSEGTGRRALAHSQPTTNSGLGPLNPFSKMSSGEIPRELAHRLARLESAVRRLEQALRYEMSVSQAMAEILVENGLISSEQLKSRLDRR